MPLYELYRSAKGKFDSEEMNGICPNDQSSIPENDFFELVWENGQVSMQGQSSRAKKIPTCRSLPCHCLPSHGPRSQDKDVGYGTNTRMGKFGDLDSGFDDNPMSVPSGEMDLSQEEDMIHWLNYTIDESLPNDYNSDLLHELSGVTVNELPSSSNFTLMDKRSNHNQAFRDTHKNFGRVASSSGQGDFSKGGEFDSSRLRASTCQLYPPSSQQCQTSFASIRSRVSNVTENNTSNATQPALCGEITQTPSASSGFPSLKMQKQDPVMSSNSSTIMNFSHFARPAAVVRANLQHMGFMSGSSSSARSESTVNKNKNSSLPTSSNPPESVLFDSIGECANESTMLCQRVMEASKANLKPAELKSLEQTASASKKHDPVCKEEACKDDQTSNQVLGESAPKGQAAGEKSVEPAVASSVCSGNGVEGGSGDPNQNAKRKSRDTEDSECHSEDVEEESVGIKKVAHGRAGMGSKRSRAAEVHNLSERRRRDRINEKMRALQELIPNCNKVDKASMLDEAIEYLKTLQLQVQVMSMGAGLYMPPMMLPPGMHPLHSPHMASYLPMGVGMQMGLGMGYAMGMPDMNGGSSRFPMIRMPQMHGNHLPVPPFPGHTALHGMARSNPQMFGLPGQGLPLPIPRVSVPLSGGPLVNSSATGLNACGAGPMETLDSASAPALKDPMPNVNSQVISTGGSNPTNQVSAHAQCEDTNAGFGQSALVHNSDRASDAKDSASDANGNGSATVNPGKEDKLMTGKPCKYSEHRIWLIFSIDCG